MFARDTSSVRDAKSSVDALTSLRMSLMAGIVGVAGSGVCIVVDGSGVCIVVDCDILESMFSLVIFSLLLLYLTPFLSHRTYS